MIKINLVREGRAAVRGTAAPGAAVAAGPSNLNNIILVVMILAGLLASGGYWLLKNRELKSKQAQIEVQRLEAQKLEKIIQEVERFQKRKDSLQKRIDLINQLKQNQKGPVRILDRISQDLPDLVWLDRMVLTGTKIDLQGRALNPNAFANYVENIKADPMFTEPEVGQLREAGKAPGGQTVYSWTMSFNFTWTPAQTAPAGGAEAPAGGAPGGGAPGGAAPTSTGAAGT